MHGHLIYHGKCRTGQLASSVGTYTLIYAAQCSFKI